MTDTQLDFHTTSILTLPDNPTPSDYGVPHPAWRPHQLETVQWAEGLSGIGIAEQPTGSGKTGIAAALAHSKRVVALTRTKNLQLQYGDLYGAHLVMGKSNYPCLHPDAEAGATPNECLYADTSMHQCLYYDTDSCPYSQAKEQALKDQFVSTNYSYWLTVEKLRKSHIGALVLDECHLVSDIVLDWSGCMIHREMALWDMPQFPKIETSKEQGKAIEWLDEGITDLRRLYSRVKKLTKVEEGKRLEKVRARLKRIEMLGFRLNAVKRALSVVEEAWFIRSGPGKCHYRGRPVPGIIIRPLTARYHWPRLFSGFSESTVLMSATVGNFKAFAEELGITEWVERRVPNQFGPDRRPIYLLDCPRMSYRSKKKDYDKQATEIAGAIKGCSTEWCGIVHVTRKTEAGYLADRLARLGLQDRVWVPPTEQGGKWLGTQDQALAWEQRKALVPNSIMVAWQFFEGFDGLDEKICIIAKVPFPSLTSEYEKQRMQFSHRFYNQRTAWKLVQALGRTRRGREEDYDIDGEMRGYVAIADMNWTRVKSYLSEDFKEAIIK